MHTFSCYASFYFNTIHSGIQTTKAVAVIKRIPYNWISVIIRHWELIIYIHVIPTGRRSISSLKLDSTYPESIQVRETNFHVKLNLKEALEALPYLIHYKVHSLVDIQCYCMVLILDNIVTNTGHYCSFSFSIIPGC